MIFRFMTLVILVFISNSISAEVRPTIVSTTSIIGDLVENILGDKANSLSLMGTGIDPHLYRPTRSDIQILTKADLVIFNGLHLEGRMDDAYERLKGSGRRVIQISKYLNPSDLIALGGENTYDPHIWMDPVIWKKCLLGLGEELKVLYPDLKDVIEYNVNIYRAKLDDLNIYIEKVVADIPLNQRVLITAHDAFSYFGKRYGLEVLSIQGVSTESESGLKEIENLVKVIVARNIKAIFSETTVSEKSISALREGVQNSGGEVSLGESLFSDAMGEKGTYRGTYEGMIDSNITQIGVALGAKISKSGLRGRL